MSGLDRSSSVESSAKAPKRRVLIVLNDADLSGAAVLEGVEWARVESAQVVFLQLPSHTGVPVLDPVGGVAMPGVHVAHAAQDRTDRRAAAALRAAGKAGLDAWVVSADEACGSADIAAVASKQRCDVIVIAHAGDNAVLRLVNGSPIPGLITSSPVPVLVCRADDRRRAGRVRRDRTMSPLGDH